MRMWIALPGAARPEALQQPKQNTQGSAPGRRATLALNRSGRTRLEQLHPDEVRPRPMVGEPRREGVLVDDVLVRLAPGKGLAILVDAVVGRHELLPNFAVAVLRAGDLDHVFLTVPMRPSSRCGAGCGRGVLAFVRQYQSTQGLVVWWRSKGWVGGWVGGGVCVCVRARARVWGGGGAQLPQRWGPAGFGIAASHASIQAPNP